MSVIPAICNFKDHYKGSTFTARKIKFNFNITGAIITCQIRQQPGSPIIYEWKTGVNITVLDYLTGEIVLNQIEDFKPIAGNYVSDVQVKFANGTIQTYLKGGLRVFQDVTVTI
jgi:hypothetical protein